MQRSMSLLRGGSWPLPQGRKYVEPAHWIASDRRFGIGWFGIGRFGIGGLESAGFSELGGNSSVGVL